MILLELISDESAVPREAIGEKAELAWSFPVHRSALLSLNTDSRLTGRTQYIYVNAMDSWAPWAGMKVDKKSASLKVGWWQENVFKAQKVICFVNLIRLMLYK